MAFERPGWANPWSTSPSSTVWKGGGNRAERESWKRTSQWIVCERMSPLAAGAWADGVWESAFSRSPPCGLFTGSKNSRPGPCREIDLLLYTSLSGSVCQAGGQAEDQPVHNFESVHFSKKCLKLIPDSFHNLYHSSLSMTFCHLVMEEIGIPETTVYYTKCLSHYSISK